MAYIAKLQGYIADVPEVIFERIDGRKFHFNQLSAASVQPNVNFTEVNAGWSLFPAAYLPAQSTMEATLTSAEFDSSLFALATGEDFSTNSSFKMPVMDSYAVANNSITLTGITVVTDSVKISGMEETSSTPSTGQFSVATSGSNTTITFASGDFSAGDVVEVYYEVTKTSEDMNVTLDTAAIGKCRMIWPLYNGGENTTASAFTGASIKGYVVCTIYRARVTAMPKHNWAM